MENMNNEVITTNTTVEETRKGLPTTGNKVVDAGIVIIMAKTAFDIGKGVYKIGKKVVGKIKTGIDNRKAAKEAETTEVPMLPEGNTSEEKTED